MAEMIGYPQLLIVAFAVVGSAIIKNGVGVGAGIFMLPFLALVFPPKIALGLGAPAMLVSDIVGIRNYWGEWDQKELLLLVPPALLAVVLSGFSDPYCAERRLQNTGGGGRRCSSRPISCFRCDANEAGPK